MDKKFTHIRAIATYKSGNKETFSCKLRSDGMYTKTFMKKLKDYQAFPTVVDIKLEKYHG